MLVVKDDKGPRGAALRSALGVLVEPHPHLGAAVADAARLAEERLLRQALGDERGLQRHEQGRLAPG